MYAYVTGLDSDNRVVFKADGTLVYPSSGGSGIPVPIADDVAIALPGGAGFRMVLSIALSSGRVYLADGGALRFFMVKTPGGDGLVQPSPTNLRDPGTGTNWGFVELTYTDAGEVFANISYVDFVGLMLSMSLTVRGGADDAWARRRRRVPDLPRAGRPDSPRRLPLGRHVRRAGRRSACCRPTATPCSTAATSGTTGAPTSTPCGAGTTGRRSSTQSPAGRVSCRVSGGRLKRGGGGGGFAKPSARDTWGCNSGPFERRAGDGGVRVAVMPRPCAAFVRSTLLLAGGDVQPGVGAAQYYTISPTSHYSRLVHALEVDGRGYAFPYDVNPDGEDASGLVSAAPDTLTVYIGGAP